jgi:hypothetical protein
MNQNSEEFYKQKYLKYKHKYLEAQKLYGEELEGGGPEYWFIVPSKVYEFLKKSSLLTKKEYSSLKALYFLLGTTSFYVKIKEKNIYTTNGNKISSTTLDQGIGLNNENKYTDDEAIRQLQQKFKNYGFFKINDNIGRKGGNVKNIQDPLPNTSQNP